VFVAPVLSGGFDNDGGKAKNRKQNKADDQHASPFLSQHGSVFYSTADASMVQIGGNPYAAQNAVFMGLGLFELRVLVCRSVRHSVSKLQHSGG
jgi:hypothetical protein